VRKAIARVYIVMHQKQKENLKKFYKVSWVNGSKKFDLSSKTWLRLKQINSFNPICFCYSTEQAIAAIGPEAKEDPCKEAWDDQVREELEDVQAVA